MASGARVATADDITERRQLSELSAAQVPWEAHRAGWGHHWRQLPHWMPIASWRGGRCALPRQGQHEARASRTTM